MNTLYILLLHSFKPRLQDAVVQLEVTLLLFLEGCSERKALHLPANCNVEALLDLTRLAFLSTWKL